MLVVTEAARRRRRRSRRRPRQWLRRGQWQWPQLPQSVVIRGRARLVVCGLVSLYLTEQAIQRLRLLGWPQQLARSARKRRNLKTSSEAFTKLSPGRQRGGRPLRLDTSTQSR